MEIARLVLEFVKALAWPVTVFILVLFFRHPLRQILSRIRKAVLPGGLSIDFEEEVKQAKKLSERVETLPLPPGRSETAAIPLTDANARMLSLGLRPSMSGLDVTYYKELSEKDPVLALAGLRIDLEIMGGNIAQGYGVEKRKNEGLSSLLSRLLTSGAITTEQGELTRKILGLCNQVVHGKSVSRREADEVIDVASVLFQQYLEWLSWGFPDDWQPGRDRQ